MCWWPKGNGKIMDRGGKICLVSCKTCVIFQLRGVYGCTIPWSSCVFDLHRTTGGPSHPSRELVQSQRRKKIIILEFLDSGARCKNKLILWKVQTLMFKIYMDVVGSSLDQGNLNTIKYISARHTESKNKTKRLIASEKLKYGGVNIQNAMADRKLKIDQQMR